MLRLFRKSCLALIAVGTAATVSAFSLLGPFDAWQTAAIGYDPTGNDAGGPMVIGEGYRWNVQTIYYAIDPSFARFYGTAGMDEIRKAFDVFNALPPFSKMRPDLSEFPLDTRQVNQQAAALGILDLKSITMGMIIEQLGLTSPDRYAFTLRATATIDNTTYYTVLQRNYDPFTFAPSRFVNGVLYTYRIMSFTDPDFVDAVEYPVDPLAIGYSPVASLFSIFNGAFSSGTFFSGLSRDDVGGLRYLYRKQNYAVENLISTALTNGVAIGGTPWSPVAGTTNIVGAALRGGIDKIVFREAKFDSTFGFYTTFTNTFSDTYITNGRAFKQSVSRDLAQPDILIIAADLGVDDDVPVPILTRRSVTDAWVNNNTLNTLGGGDDSTTAGPGQVEPGIVFSFSSAGPYIINSTPDFLDEANQTGTGGVIGSFDHTTNPPVIYPSITVRELEDAVLGGN